MFFYLRFTCAMMENAKEYELERKFSSLFFHCQWPRFFLVQFYSSRRYNIFFWFWLQAIFLWDSFEYFCINKKGKNRRENGRESEHLQKLMNFIAKCFSIWEREQLCAFVDSCSLRILLVYLSCKQKKKCKMDEWLENKI